MVLCAERSIAPLFPFESFPYTVRITSEVWNPMGPQVWRRCVQVR